MCVQFVSINEDIYATFFCGPSILGVRLSVFILLSFVLGTVAKFAFIVLSSQSKVLKNS